MAWPASDVQLLARLGVTDVGENRDQEAAPKHADCAELPLRWHFIGQVQRNKAASIAAERKLFTIALESWQRYLAGRPKDDTIFGVFMALATLPDAEL